MDKAKQHVHIRKERAARVRKKVFGTTGRPRLCVFRSARHIYAQIVDDLTGKSLVQTGSTAKEVAARKAADAKGKLPIAKIVGEVIAEKAKDKGISKVVFDRKGYQYHGRVQALADGARAKGLVF